MPGCLYAFYPDTYDASDFGEFYYRFESDPPCLGSRDATAGYFRLCEAAITREAEGEYLLVLEGHTGDSSDSHYLVERAMTGSEVEDMLALFRELHYNLHPQPFCAIPAAGIGFPESYEYVFRWDGFELVGYDCDRARLDWERGVDIYWFLISLLPEDETVETP
ncbi:hypothetical protein KKH27_00535 [bacterium]|nr:hypothetical protein [bacterium]